MAFHITDARLGSQPIAEASSTQQHPLGTMVRAVDTTYGEGVFIYLQGVVNTQVGSAVVYDQKAHTSTLLVSGLFGPVAVAMAATGANQYGWYQVRGSAVVRSDSAAVGNTPAADAPGFITNTGGVGDYVDGLAFRTANGTPAAGFAVLELAFPSSNGR